MLFFPLFGHATGPVEYTPEQFGVIHSPLSDEPTGRFVSCVYANERYVLSGRLTASNTGSFWTSDDDGATWTRREQFGLNHNAQRLRYLAGCLVACEGFTSTSHMYYSLDNGDTWTQHSIALSSGYTGAATDGTKILVFGKGDGDYTASADAGVTWDASLSGFPGGGMPTNVRDVAYGNGYWVVVDARGNIGYSTTGDDGDWTLLNAPGGSPEAPNVTAPFGFTALPFTGSTIEAIVFDGTYFVIVGETGQVAYATVPTSWTIATPAPTTASLKRIAFNEESGAYLITTDSADFQYFLTSDLSNYVEGHFNLGTADGDATKNYTADIVDVAAGAGRNFIFCTPVSDGAGVGIYGFAVPPGQPEPSPVDAACFFTTSTPGIYLGNTSSHCLAGN